MKIFSYFAVLILILVAACRESSGPCEYVISEVQAEVHSIEPYSGKDSTQLYHIILRFNGSGLSKQMQLLEDWLPRVKGKTDAGFIERNQIKKGEIITATVSEIKSGNCQPVYVSFNYYFITP